MNRQAIATTAAPAAVGPYSQAIVAGDLVFCAGQGAIDPATQDLRLGTIEEETRLTIENLTTVLGQAGATLSQVVRCGVFLADIGDFAAMNAEYAEIFPDPKPARTTIGCALAGGIKVEIDCIAVLPH